MTIVRQRFSIIPAMAVTDHRLEPRDLQVLCLLGRHTDDLGWCCRSQVKMAKELNCGRATVQRALGRLVEAGYLEHRSKQRESGADAAHDYRVVIDPPDVAGKAENPAENPTQKQEGGVPTGGQGCPPMDGQGVPTHERAPMLTTPVKREERGARESEGEEVVRQAHDEGGDVGAAGDDPAKFEKRVKRLAADLDWPGWANSSTAWTVAQFAKLTAGERAEAERRAEDYLAATGRKALSLGTYFAERKWRDVPEPEPEGPKVLIAAPFGPVWAGMMVRALLVAPAHPSTWPVASAFQARLLAQDDALGRRARLERQARYGWPAVNAMFEQADRRRGVPMKPEDERLKALVEAVPVGSKVHAAWRAEFERRGWPWLPDHDGMRAVHFPAGGPEGMDAFEAAVTGNGRQEAVSGAAANREGKERDDERGCEAAE